MPLYIVQQQTEPGAAPRFHVFSDRETAWAWFALLQYWRLGTCSVFPAAGGLDAAPEGLSYADLACHHETSPKDPRIDAFVERSIMGVSEAGLVDALDRALHVRGESEGSYFSYLAHAQLTLRRQRLRSRNHIPDSIEEDAVTRDTVESRNGFQIWQGRVPIRTDLGASGCDHEPGIFL